MTRIIIDTDAGVDDSLAIIYAARSPELHVEMISTVSGNVPVEEVTQNVLLLRRLLTLDADISSGAALPLKKQLVTAPEVHGADGLGGYRRQTNTNFNDWKTADAAEKIVEAARRLRKELTIVSIGPMTNIARAVGLDTDAMRGIRGIIQMGGVFHGYGNTTTFTEFNIFVDPDAADFVLKSGVRVRFVPLDLTEKIFMPRNILTSLLNSTREMTGELKKLVRQSVSYYMAYHRLTDKLDGCFLHDPVTVAAAVNPAWFRFVDAFVSVETTGALTSGMTLADFRTKKQRSNSAIAVGINGRMFLQDFAKKLFGLTIPARVMNRDCLRDKFSPEFTNSLR
ncbi:MAG: nucleoside hydrolase [Bacteroidetes bacterium]|nr:nucleoside hydrolase [Bacteroidota bacterium]